MKKRVLIVMTGLGLLLTGCQTNTNINKLREEDGSGSTMQNYLSNSVNSMSSSESGADETLQLEDTEYGRGATSDGDDTNSVESPTRFLTSSARSIIIYFSRSGNTENLARMIHNENNADMLELSVTNPYPANYEESVERATEERESQNYPEISTEIPDLSQYETVFLGYQTWAMTLSNPMTSFLLEYGKEFDGKTIYPFSTNAGYGEGNSLNRIAEYSPGAVVAESFSIQDKDLLDNQDEVVRWVSNINK